MTVLPCPGARAWTAPSRADSARAASANAAEKRWRPTNEVNACVAWSTPLGSGLEGATEGAELARSGGPPACTEKDA